MPVIERSVMKRFVLIVLATFVAISAEAEIVEAESEDVAVVRTRVQGNLPEALSALSRALESLPEIDLNSRLMAYERRANVKAELGEKEKLFFAGLTSESLFDWANAAEYYDKSLASYQNGVTAWRLAACCAMLGDFENALENIDKSIQLDSTNVSFLMDMANILCDSGRAQEAIDEMSHFIARAPDNYLGYYRRGFFKNNIRDVDGAIEDYSMAIALEPRYAYAYLGRADMYAMKGESELAKADYEKVVALDALPQPFNESCAHFAYLELGQNDKAVERMNRQIA